MELTGKIKALFDPQNISASFRKRELVLLTPGRFPQQILVEFTQDKIDLLDNAHEGDEVRIQIDIRGREWTSPRGDVKYFVSIQGWRIEPLHHAQGHDGPPGHHGGHPGHGGPPPGYGGPPGQGGPGPRPAGPPGGPPPFDDVPPPDSEYGSEMRPDDDIPF